MGHFATFSHVQDNRRTAIRVVDDGTASLLVTAQRGEIVKSVDGRVDPTEAADIVADMMLVAPELPNTGGEYSFGLGEGESAPRLSSFSRDQMPPDAFSIEQRMRDLVAQLAAQAPAPEPISPRRTVGMSTSSFAMWTAAFFAGHVGGAIASLILAGLLVKAVGIAGLLLALPAIVVVIGAIYFLIGMQFGKRYGGKADAWKPAMAAVVLPSVVSALMGGGFVHIGIAFIFPLCARWGASD